MARNKKPTAVEQLNQELGALPIMGFNCPKCGGVLHINPSKLSTYCQYCGAPLPKAEELLKLCYDYMEKNKDRQMELSRMKHEERITSTKTFHERAVAIMGILAILTGLFMFGSLVYVILR